MDDAGFIQEATNQPQLLFQDDDLRQQFILIDFREIRVRYLASPANFVEAAANTELLQHELPGVFICTAKLPGGDYCGQQFLTRGGLLNHRRRARGLGGEHEAVF
eukprot:16050159-Heterocapsa_arctica.AAC.1